jgi:hypothetical protein
MNGKGSSDVNETLRGWLIASWKLTGDRTEEVDAMAVGRAAVSRAHRGKGGCRGVGGRLEDCEGRHFELLDESLISWSGCSRIL